MRRTVYVARTVLAVASVAAAAGGLAAWPLYGPTTARITFVSLFVLFGFSALVGLQPQHSRRHRWGHAGLWLTVVGAGGLMLAGVTGRSNRDTGFAILVAVAIQLFAQPRATPTALATKLQPLTDRVKAVLFWLFGGPDIGWFESFATRDADRRR
jgi:hypothetical protein